MKRTSTDLGLLILRIALGVVFVMHGGQKLFVMGPSALAGFLGSIGVPFHRSPSTPGRNVWCVNPWAMRLTMYWCRPFSTQTSILNGRKAWASPYGTGGR